jgi:hypothetical protein
MQISIEITGIRFSRRRKMVMDDYIKEKEKALHERKLKWWNWHKDNPEVWEKFKDYTFEAINSGRNKYSQWAIINRIRWNSEIETKGGEFKISNDYICFYARLFHAKFPQHDSFFTVKPLKEEKEIDEYQSYETRLQNISNL